MKGCLTAAVDGAFEARAAVGRADEGKGGRAEVVVEEGGGSAGDCSG